MVLKRADFQQPVCIACFFILRFKTNSVNTPKHQDRLMQAGELVDIQGVDLVLDTCCTVRYSIHHMQANECLPDGCTNMANHKPQAEVSFRGFLVHTPGKALLQYYHNHIESSY
jgi:hypothetical protein